MNRRRSAPARHAFTLLELIVVAAMIAVMASIVLVTVRGHLHRAKLLQSAARIEALDRRARSEARRFSVPMEIAIDPPRGRLSLAGPVTSNISLPTSVTIERVDRLRVNQHGGDRRTTIPISPRGQSASYVLKLTTPDDAALWLVTIGLSGQQLRFQTEAQVHALFATTKASSSSR